MTAKSVLMRPQGLRPRARAPTYPTPCYLSAIKPLSAISVLCMKIQWGMAPPFPPLPTPMGELVNVSFY